MTIKAFLDVREENIFDMCFFVHKVVGFSKAVIIDGVGASCLLTTLFRRISEEFKLIDVMKAAEIVRLVIGGIYMLGERDCKSTILDHLNQYDMFIEIGKYRCKLFVNVQEIALSFPKSAVSNYPLTPNIVEINKYFDVRACEFKWLKCATNPKTEQTMEWIEVGTSYVYVPTPDDCGNFLKFVCTPKTAKGIAKSMVAVANSPVLNGVPKPTYFIERCTNTLELKEYSFRTVSYNVLADMYVKKCEDRGELSYCPYYALDLTYRMELVLKELAGYNADVICLQELDHYAYCHMFRNFFEKRGYTGIFCMKHPNLYEGLACFYRMAKFRLCESTYTLFPKDLFHQNSIFQNLCAEVSKNKNYAAAFKRNQNSLLCAVFETVGDSPQYLVVGNTQLRSGLENVHIRLVQAAMVVDHLQHLITKYKQEVPNAQLASLLCGDMNSQPNSNVYKFLTTGYLSADCPDWCSKEGEEFEGMPLLHELSLKSAYDNLSCTNYVPVFKGCIDYIFYDSDNLQLVQNIPLPSEELLQAETALPSLTFPSDHLALIADFGWQLDVAANVSHTLSCLQVSRQAVPRAPKKERGRRGRNVRNM